ENDRRGSQYAARIRQSDDRFLTVVLGVDGFDSTILNQINTAGGRALPIKRRSDAERPCRAQARKLRPVHYCRSIHGPRGIIRHLAGPLPLGFLGVYPTARPGPFLRNRNAFLNSLSGQALGRRVPLRLFVSGNPACFLGKISTLAQLPTWIS